MKTSDYMINFLAEKGIEHIFYVAGGGCMHLLDSLGRHPKLTDVSMIHEQGASIAAESYAFAGDRVGACLLTTGPGATNAITGMLSSYIDSIPVIFISGQVKTTDLKGNFGVRTHGSQEADIISMVKENCNYAHLITEKESVRYHLEKAWYEATTGRKGSVWLDVPLDIQGSQIEPDLLEGFVPEERAKADFSKEIDVLLQMIQESKRPVVLAGNGLRHFEPLPFLEKLNIPVIPSWKFVDVLPNDHPIFAGKCGTLGERTANFAMQTADLVISIGCRLDFSVTGFDRSNWATHGKKVMIDIDATEMDKLGIDLDLRILGDLEDFVPQIMEKTFTVPQFTEWKGLIQSWHQKYPVGWTEGTSGMISTYDMVNHVFGQIDDTYMVVPASAGTIAEIVTQTAKIKKGVKVRSQHGLGPMGYELPSAVGAHLGTGKQVALFAGDGGVQLNIQALSVISGRNLPIKIFVSVNGGYGSIMNMQRNHFEGRYVGANPETGLFLPDFQGLAQAYGVPCVTITNPDTLEKEIGDVLSMEGPVWVNVHTDPLCIVSPRATSKVQPDGSMKSSPLEDLYPFLPEDLLQEELNRAFEIK